MKKIVSVIIVLTLWSFNGMNSFTQDTIRQFKAQTVTNGFHGHAFIVGTTFQLNDNRRFKNKILEFGYVRLYNYARNTLDGKGHNKFRAFNNHLKFSGVIYISDKPNFGVIIGDRIGITHWLLVGLNSIVNTDFNYCKLIIRPDIGVCFRGWRFDWNVIFGVDFPVNTNSYYFYNKTTYQISLNFYFKHHIFCWDNFAK